MAQRVLYVWRHSPLAVRANELLISSRINPRFSARISTRFAVTLSTVDFEFLFCLTAHVVPCSLPCIDTSRLNTRTNQTLSTESCLPALYNTRLRINPLPVQRQTPGKSSAWHISGPTLLQGHQASIAWSSGRLVLCESGGTRCPCSPPERSSRSSILCQRNHGVISPWLATAPLARSVLAQ